MARIFFIVLTAAVQFVICIILKKVKGELNIPHGDVKSKPLIVIDSSIKSPRALSNIYQFKF